MGVTLVFLGVYNCVWSFRGPRAIARGDYSPPAFYLAFVFFTALSWLAFMTRYFLKPDGELWVILSLTLPLITAIIGIVGHKNGTTLKARQFYSLYGALPQALAIAELAKYDLAEAERVADECYRLIGERARKAA